MRGRRFLGAFVLASASIGSLAVDAEAARASAIVTNANDSGPGSLRDALATGAHQVVIQPQVGTIVLASSLVYAAPSGLTIVGNGQIIDGNGLAGPLLQLTQGGDLSLLGLTFEDSGGSGIVVTVPVGRTGTVRVSATRVTVRDTADHGLFVDDGAGSPASVNVTAVGSTFWRAGAVNADQDGVRVDERGEGGIAFASRNSTFEASGGDGVELDEGGAGSVTVSDVGGRFVDNGPLVPDDLEDGIDVDEADSGSVDASFVGSELARNFDEGADLNELGEGGINARFVNVSGTGTIDGEAIALEEHDDGDVDLALRNVTTTGNGNDGVEVEETEDGSLRVDAVRLVSNGNDADGLHVEEVAAGDVAIRLTASTITENADDGIQAEQGAPGAGTLRLIRTNVSGNLDDQINLDGVTQL